MSASSKARRIDKYHFAQQLAHYMQHGYVVFRQLMSANEIAAIDKHVERIYSDWYQQNEADIFTYKMVNMHSLTLPEYFEECVSQRVTFFDLLAGDKLVRVLDTLFGEGLYFHNTQLFFNPTNPERLPYWHRDMQYSDLDDAQLAAEQNNMLSLHVRIPLTDETGVELIGGSHKRWDTELERNVRLQLNGHTDNEPLPNSKLISLATGDVLIFNAQMIHRGNYSQNASRKALDLCIGKYHRLTAGALDKRVLPSEEEMLKLKHRSWFRLAANIGNTPST
ncbi:phytanoyl-CoA dioxygenase family protein [Glaciecola sp. XM2]|uniref:phytanoyl-CoA dioxygenase family protein n=1 Tax=Glaciecola sp. XM2 TaxID=1914931 RepID=UPI001BDE3D2E|nr:phytanoyl-CoA dioxygenase family protein [Glaciecola sp. XM2]MBT1449484.1 phytanoyl-CoA dioxygenase family protein [Glaciecola sp. XM2]